MVSTEAHFDFGTTSSPLEAGYTRITENTLYTADTGYGWTSTLNLYSRDRGAPDNLKRDFIQSRTEHTFNVDLANGEYTVTLTMGDYFYIHDMIDVYAEGVQKINDLTAYGGTFQKASFSTTISDGQLNLRILDSGGTDANWVINTLTIVSVST